VTVNGRLNNTNHFQIENYGLSFYMDSGDDPPATGIKILGVNLPNSRIRMYNSRKVELGWIVFNEGRKTKLNGGPGWVEGLGSNDSTGWGNNSIHDCVFNLLYLRVPDANGDNGDDGVQHPGSLDFYNNKMISVVTTGFAGANHRTVSTSKAYVRIWNNYLRIWPTT
jgi:hypothetical protein